MKAFKPLETERLLIRQWQPEDREPFAALNADPDVMEFFPNPLSRIESDAMADRIHGLIEEKGYGFWAVDEKSSGSFIGFVGLNEPGYELPFNPCLEIGWRLAKAYWGKGYAPEAAGKALEFAFETLNREEVVSFTTTTNIRSQTVMKKLGFNNSGQDFDHPALSDGHPLQRHVLFTLSRKTWLNGKR